MSEITTVALEILRHGPAHNQLLSPLTRYLALCGNHSAVTVAVPYEHQQMLGRLRILQYKGGGSLDDSDARTTREIQMQETAASIADLLGAIKPLLAEVANVPDDDPRALLHLELVLSASELGLLPFELGTAPEGFPGAGQPLVLQNLLPLCLTRRVRRVDNRHFEWPKEPKILFAVAAPPAVGQVPIESHLLALRKAVDPWVWHARGGDPRKEVERHLELLTEASVERLEAACRRGRFTHVHLLAHGVPTHIAGDDRHGIALHDSRDPSRIDVVDGQRLAAVLAGDGRGGTAVVTLASCDSGNVGSVISAGASVAHALHEAGIPLVVASQFPLSFAGSVLMVQVLYDRLLDGRDPRRALVDLRRQLRTMVPGTHDWASLVAYAALPPDFEEQRVAAEIRQAKRRIDAALNHADAALRDAEDGKAGGGHDGDAEERFRAALGRLLADNKRLRKLLPAADAARKDEDLRRQRVQVAGLLGSVGKREAQVAHEAAALLTESGEVHPEVPALRRRSLRCLRVALDDYSIVVRTDFGQSWGLVQVLALSLVLRRDEARWRDLWIAARLASEEQLRNDDTQQVLWAISALVELWILAPVAGAADPETARTQALRYAEDFVRHPQRRWIDLHAAKSQIARFSGFFTEIEGSRFTDAANEVVATRELAKSVHERLEDALRDCDED